MTGTQRFHMPNSPFADLSQAISDSLDRLDNSTRELIELHLQIGLTFREIAEVIAEPLPTVASRYRRAIRKLAEDIKVRHE